MKSEGQQLPIRDDRKSFTLHFILFSSYCVPFGLFDKDFLRRAVGVADDVDAIVRPLIWSPLCIIIDYTILVCSCFYVPNLPLLSQTHLHL